MLKVPPDISLLKLFVSKDIYAQYIQYVKSDTLEPEIKTILSAYYQYFKQFNKDIEISDFNSWFFHYHSPDLPDSKRLIYKGLLNKIDEADPDIVESVLLRYQEYATTKKLQDALYNKFNFEKLQAILNEHIERVGRLEDEDIIPNNLDEIVKSARHIDGLNWRLSCLRDSIGPMNKGMFIIVAAYVDVGKTAFAVSEATYMARQLKEGCVMWLNNEEDDYRVYKKLWKSTLGITEKELLNYPEEAKKEYLKRMHGDMNRIKFVNIRNKSLTQIENLFETHKPKLVVIDQVDKIAHGYKAFSDHDRLKDLYGKVRDLANTYCPIIAISQADVTTTYMDRESGDMKYMLYPHHRQLDGSKVGKPGEADAIIMIGRRLECPETRGIHVSKNKFGQTTKLEVLFDGNKCRYEDPF